MAHLRHARASLGSKGINSHVLVVTEPRLGLFGGLKLSTVQAVRASWGQLTVRSCAHRFRSPVRLAVNIRPWKWIMHRRLLDVRLDAVHANDHK